MSAPLTLPNELKDGRSAWQGPVTGPVATLTFGSFTYGTSTGPDLSAVALVMPVDFRITSVSWAMASATANCSFQILNGANDILSADVDLDVTPSGFARPSGTPTTLIAAQRTIARGSLFSITVTTDISGLITNFTVVVEGFVLGVVAKDQAND